MIKKNKQNEVKINGLYMNFNGKWQINQENRKKKKKI